MPEGTEPHLFQVSHCFPAVLNYLEQKVSFHSAKHGLLKWAHRYSQFQFQPVKVIYAVRPLYWPEQEGHDKIFNIL